jgi:hypothetical protein
MAPKKEEIRINKSPATIKTGIYPEILKGNSDLTIS